MSSSDRALVNAFKEISNMADRINLPRTIVDRANNLFKQVRVAGLHWVSLGYYWFLPVSILIYSTIQARHGFY